ncbi:uncharacterized protein LOC133302104 [Gastrolobium bilobum]|uniref:uncharacterized protein LOC133302104 n=1 Tax=Gastrolobium bilobum TaxID=150636 RepID=UPI002AB2AC1B|nr:uncharacterized protein LOC133302104 [Gastrolobium bilobum]
MGGFVSTPRTHMETGGDSLHQPPKLLLNVNIENSLGAIQVLMQPEDTVADLVKAALGIYDKEKRRPLLKHTDPKCYDLHYSPYSLQSLKSNEKLKNLVSRNFFLRSKPPTSSL